MLIGITGTQGAGKGTVVEYLKEKGYKHCSARGLILEEVEKRGIEPTRANISMVANELREQFGADFVVKEYFRRSPEAQNIVIESIYTLAEVEALRERGGIILAIDADPEIRYERIHNRGDSTDHVSKEEFLEFQKKESESNNPAQQNMRAVFAVADFVIFNDNEIVELQKNIDVFLAKYKK